MIRIKHTFECECGEELSSTTLDLSQEPGGTVEINLDMFGGFTLDCGACGRTYYVPDLCDHIEEVD
jgi:hypothetical protein